MFVKYEGFNPNNRVFEFGNGVDSDNVLLANNGASTNIAWGVHRGGDYELLVQSSWDVSTWTHVVVTVAGPTMKMWKDGVLVGTKMDGHEPRTLMRARHWLGRSMTASYFEGSIAYVRVWHGVELGEGEVEALYNERELL